MNICAYDEDNKKITVDEFFARHSAFSDYQLKYRTARYLKTLMRNHNRLGDFANAVDGGYELELSDDNCTYRLRFNIEQDCIQLKELM